MRATQFGGMLVVSAMMALQGCSAVAALGTEEGLSKAMERVEQVREEIKNCGLNCKSEFAGVDGYLGRLLDSARDNSKTEDEIRQYTAALDDAADAAMLLSGLKAYQTEQQRAQQMAASRKTLHIEYIVGDEESVNQKNEKTEPAESVIQDTKTQTVAVPQTGKAVQAAQQTTKDGGIAKSTNSTESSEMKTEVAGSEKVTGEKNEKSDKAETEQADVPTTGKPSEKKVGVEMLVVAGVAVVIATTGATILIIRMKKDV